MSDDGDSFVPAITRDPSEPASVSGHQTPSHAEADADDMIERLAVEGVEEAQHDQMVAARHRRAP